MSAAKNPTWSKKFDDIPKSAKSGRTFTDLVKTVAVDDFVRMVSHSGIPSTDSRELILAFKDLKK